MSVIDSYLDTLFDPYPSTPRMREARAELRAMMEDKQQALLDQGLSESQSVGQVIAEFGTLEEVAPILGIDTELGSTNSAAPGPPRLAVERAREYAEAVRRNQGLLSLAVPLFVLCPVPLLLLIALSEQIVPEPEGWAVIGGIVALLVIVTIGVVTLVIRDGRLAEVKDIEEGRFQTTPEVRQFATTLRREHRGRSVPSTAIAIGLWILCAVPVVIAAVLADGENDPLPLYGVCLTLGMVALGLWIMLRSTWADGVADTLENEGEEDDFADAPTPVRVIAAIYWPLTVGIYLLWSFATGDWDITWMVWPVAGVLYGALWAVAGALSAGTDRSERR